MKVFVVGATGVIGRAAVRALQEAGHSVVGLARTPEKAALLGDMGAEPVTGDLFHMKSLEAGTSAAEAVIHLASAMPRKLSPRHEDWNRNERIRMEGTKNLITAALRSRTALYIQGSVVSVYGDHRGKWVDENAPLRPARFDRSAVEMEEWVLHAHRIEGLPAIIMRQGLPYSADAWHIQETLRLLRSGRRLLLGDGSRWLNVIHPDDMAQGILKAIERRPVARITGHIVNMVDDEPLTIRDLIRVFARELKVRPPWALPRLLGRLALTRGLPCVPPGSVRVRNSRAKALLGWTPRYPRARDRIPEEVRRWRASAEGSP